MKWKTILLFVLAALLIAGAFVVPPVLLRSAVSQTMNKPFSIDTDVLNLRAAENTVEKLASFSDPEATAVSLRPETDLEQLNRMLHRELRALYASDAIPQAVYGYLDAAANEDLAAERACVIQPEQHLMFEVYVIHIRSIDAQLLLDLSSEKLLGLRYYIFDMGLLDLEYEETQAIRELQGWADYLELNPGPIYRTDFSIQEIAQSAEPGNEETPIILKRMILTDNAGFSIPFGQSFALLDGIVESYTWGSFFRIVR